LLIIGWTSFSTSFSSSSSSDTISSGANSSSATIGIVACLSREVAKSAAWDFFSLKGNDVFCYWRIRF
jgi:hypothetical protein